MSEPKRVVPQCLEFPDSLGHANKKEKKREKGKQQLAPSFRFSIALPESNDKEYSEFNYAQLVKTAEKKRRKEEHRTNNENPTNGLDPFESVDADEDKLKEMATRFEAKYGNANAGRKRHKYDDYVDLGAGYDENDSFIDNTDAYDEIVPGEVTTAYGGFYINSGPLEFKPADGNSPVHSRLNNNITSNNNNNNNNNNIEDEEEESSEASGEDEEDIGNRVLQRMEKRPLSSSDEEDDEEDDNDEEDDIISGDPPRKKHKSEENGDKKTNHENVMKRKRKLPVDSTCNPSNQQQTSEDIEVMTNVGKINNDVKRDILDVECSSEDQEERKRTKYELIKTKVTTTTTATTTTTTTTTSGEKKYDVKRMEKKMDIKRFEKKSSSLTTNGLDVKKIDMKKFIGKDSNIDDAIESVVNAGRAEDESSRDTMDSGKSHFPAGTDSEFDDTDKDEIQLPEELPDDIKETINMLKNQADKNRDGKGKIFDENFNATLLTLEEKLRMMNSPSTRLLTYAHLAPFLRCNKATLVTRAKKLCLDDADRKMRNPLHRLKGIIEGMMPGVVERYAKECQRVAEEKGLEGSPAEIDSSDAENSEKSKIPRKKFPWTTEIKKLIYDIACARRHYFKMRKPRKECMETFVATYMESKVLPIWPGGWVRLQTLLKYSNPEPVEKRKQKKYRDSTVSNSLISSSVSSSMMRQELTNVSSCVNVATTICQDRPLTPTNFPKITTDAKLPTATTTTTTTTTGNIVKSNDTNERKNLSKIREKNSSSPINQDNNLSSCNRDAKITVVPTSQLTLPNKCVKSIGDKFNPMNLTSSSLSITPVSDYQKICKISTSEMKKDVVSITPYSETTTTMTTSNNNSGNDSPTKVITMKQTETKSEKRNDEKIDITNESCHKSEKREKRRERWHDDKHRSNETKKRRRELKSLEQNVENSTIATTTTATTTTTTTTTTTKSEMTNQRTSLTKEEQEQRQIEETTAATNFLSQIIDDLPSRVTNADKRKEQINTNEDNTTSIVVQQTSEQDNEVQMVMRSLKEIQELQEMKYSPSHSPVSGGGGGGGGGQQKSNKSSHRYVGYQDDYPRIYNKKDDKIRVTKEEASSW